MRKLFLYYSRTGNGDLVANYFKRYDFETYKVEPKHELPKSFFWGTLFGGMLAGMNRKATLKDFKINLNDYDEIVVGSPTWNGKFSTPINTVLKKLKNYNGKVLFVLYAGGGEAKQATLKVSKMYADTRSIVLKEPKKYQEQFDLLDEFIRKNG